MRNILFISHKNYNNEFIRGFEELGFHVTYYDDKPSESFICKALGRSQFGIYQKVLEKYYNQIIEKNKNIKYEYIVIINGEYTPENSLIKMKKKYPDSKVILYLWDSLKNKKNLENKFEYFDKCYSFDRKDCLANSQLNFMPLFYIDTFSTEDKKEFKYDLAFIGTGHGDRCRIIKEIEKQCTNNNKTMFSYLYCPHKLVFFYNKLFNKDYRNIRMKDLHFCKISYDEIAKVYHQARCIVDIESKSQTGLTIRTIEILGMRKKLITTNKDIVQYNFYNEKNIKVVERTNFEIDFEFLEYPYEKLSDELYESYSLKQRIKQILELD